MSLYLGESLIASNLAGGDTNPIGSVIAFAGSNAPVGYLMCDGSAVSRETYADLFAVIGTTYGAGDGSTTFNLPDFKEEEKTLLWTNSNKTITSTYSGGDINIGKNILGYIGFEIVFRRFYNRQEVENAKYYRNQAIDSSMFAPVGAVDISGNIPQASSALQSIVYSRTFYRSGDDKIYVSDCKRRINGSAPVTGEDTGVLVPIFIYGITRSVPIIKATHNVTIQGVGTIGADEIVEKRTLLWTNPNPSASFSAQTISLDLSGYDCIDMLINDDFSSGGWASCGTYRRYEKDMLSKYVYFHGTDKASANKNMSTRSITPTSAGVVVSDNTVKEIGVGTVSTHNEYNIPYKIYGIKRI